MSLWSNVFRPAVADRAGLVRYVISVTLFSWMVAITADVVNQLSFFTNWPDALREWSVTTVVVLAIAAPIARTMGRAHLALHNARQEAERLSRTDPLTGLANRRAFYEAAAHLKDGTLALVIADIDRFKRVNDSFGHGAGDEVIKAVASRMQAQLGDLGVVARLGGEEFALIAADRPPGAIRERLQSFRSGVAEVPVVADGRALQTTVSIGYAERGGMDFDALYAAADKALYVAKGAGRDRIVAFDEIAALEAGLLRAG